MDRLDWDDLGVLIAVAREGSLRLAAERLRVSAATASRRLSRLETHLGEVLVDRAEDGCELTPFGQEVVAWARAMENAASAIERLRETQNSDSLGGIVRINADEWMTAFLAGRVRTFHARHPNVEIDLVASARPLSLARREADIALRKRLPEDGQLRVKRVGSVAWGLFAAPAFVDGHAAALGAGDWASLDMVAHEDGQIGAPATAWLRANGPERPRLRCSHALAVTDAVASGAGIGLLPHHIGETGPLACIRPRIPELTEELWVVIHEALSGSSRVKVVGDFLADLFRREAALLRGDAATACATTITGERPGARDAEVPRDA